MKQDDLYNVTNDPTYIACKPHLQQYFEANETRIDAYNALTVLAEQFFDSYIEDYRHQLDRILQEE